MKKIILLTLLFLINISMPLGLLYAETQPKFKLNPISPITFSLAQNDVGTVAYQVTNQTTIMRTLTTVPIQGISQITGNGLCSSPFTLASKSTCMLLLRIDGSKLSTLGVKGGPEVCKTKGSGDNSPTPFLCSQPSALNSLNVTAASSPRNFSLFVTNENGNSVTICPLDANGIFTNCSIPPSSGPFNDPPTIVFNPTGSFAYITNYGLGAGTTVSKCAINNLGNSITGCSTAGNGFNGPVGIALNNMGTVAYVSNDSNNTLSKCNIEVSDPLTIGDFSSCATQNPVLTIPFASPVGIALNAANTFLYVANYGANDISKCSIDPNSGDLVECVQAIVNAADPIVTPHSVTFNALGTFAYVPNITINTVSKCIVDNDGSLIGCSYLNPTGAPFVAPHTIAFNSSGTLAYISNYSGPSVSTCSVNASGDFTSCTATTDPTFNLPGGVALR